MAEQPPCKRQVGGSNPFSGSLGRGGDVSEKTEVRLWVGIGASVMLLLDANVFYFREGELFGPLFIGNVLVVALVVGFVLVSPHYFTRSRLRERNLEWRRDRTRRTTTRVIVGLLLGVLLSALAALLLNSYLSGYRMV